jgi:hypothetical protein
VRGVDWIIANCPEDVTMSAEELARLALKALECIEEERKRPDFGTVASARDAERRLRGACKAVLSPPAPGLFDAPIKEGE